MNRSPLNNDDATVVDRIAYWLGTGFGAGLVPIAPGTIGALEGVAIYIGLALLHLDKNVFLFLIIAIDVVLFALGVWASNRTCALTRLKDPSLLVIDEVNGQMIALTGLAFFPSLSILPLVIGFLLFRIFDIFKPYPIRKLERLNAGLGVMADDALAGIYAAILLSLGRYAGLT